MEERDQSSVQRPSRADLYQKYFENKMILTLIFTPFLRILNMTKI